MARDEVPRSTGGADSTRTSPLERCFLQNPAIFSVDCRGVCAQDMTGECLLRDEKNGDDGDVVPSLLRAISLSIL